MHVSLICIDSHDELSHILISDMGVMRDDKES